METFSITVFKDQHKHAMLNREPLDFEASIKLRNHSPTGFNWGYSGSGPAQLSLACCVALFGKINALTLYQRFKDFYISKIPQEDNMSDKSAENLAEFCLYCKSAVYSDLGFLTVTFYLQPFFYANRLRKFSVEAQLCDAYDKVITLKNVELYALSENDARAIIEVYSNGLEKELFDEMPDDDPLDIESFFYVRSAKAVEL